MSVSGVNNSNNNAGTYAAGAAVVGGGAAGAYGYFSRPFLKDGAPTDAFVKNVKTKQNLVLGLAIFQNMYYNRKVKKENGSARVAHERK